MSKPAFDKLLQFARRQPPFFWLVVCAGLIAFCLFTINGIVGYRASFYDKFGYQVGATAHGIVVVRVDTSGPAQGKLQIGDVIRSLSGPAGEVPVQWYRTLAYALHHAPVGTAYTLHIERQGVELAVPLQLEIYRVPNSDERWRILSAILNSLPFAVVALLVGLLRPHDPNARRAFYAMLGFALNYFLSGVVDDSAHMLSGVWLVFWVAHLTLSGATLFIALIYNLYCQFPAGAPPGRVWLWLKWLLLGAGTAIWVAGIARYSLLASGVPITAGLIEFMRRLRLSNDAYIGLGLLATCVVCLYNFLRVSEPDQRNRIRLISFATLLAFTPHILFYLSRLIEPVWPGPILKDFQAAVNVAGEFSPLLMATAWGYAILKHRVLGVEMVVRRGVRYLLARNVLRLLLALPLLWLLAGFIADPNRTLKELLIARPFNLVLMALALLSLKFREQLLTWLDRRFFRTAYKQEQLLLALIEQIKDFSTLAEMSRRVGQQIMAALHPSRLYIYYLAPDQPRLTLSFSSDETVQQIELPADAQLNRTLATSGVALARSTDRLSDLPQHEQAWLTALKAELIVPLQGLDERLLGLLICGEKRSEEPYTTQDRNLLQAIARQMAVVAENLQLKERVNHELQIKHNVLAQLDHTLINLLKECPACGTCYDSALNYCLEDGCFLTLTLPVERTIDGKYRLERLLGKGGMGAVYAATDLRLRRRVALKVITGELLGKSDALQRFQREARTSAGLNHPNIVAVYDYGQAGAEGAYLVMEFLAGVSLRGHLNSIGAVPPRVAADWFKQLLDGVKAAHQAGIIHRDLKPENILLVTAEQGPPLLKILDFGLAKLRGPSISANLTTPGMLIGTPNYMAPEQLVGQEADERSDLFAIGVMAVETITGQRPFSGDSYQQLLANITTGAYRLPGQGAEIARLDAVLQRCLAPQRESRYASAEALQADLIPALQACPPLAAIRQRAITAETLIGSVVHTQSHKVGDTVTDAVNNTASSQPGETTQPTKIDQ
jgi:eukaryotic-like serine/threonine-protein kinase